MNRIKEKANQLASLIYGRSVDEAQAEGCCTICGRKVSYTDFRDPLSWREYKISGLCQKCQDEVFGT